MLVLGVESSCDETGLALYDTECGLLSHALHSQVEMHAEYGGVVPELASRDHIRRVLPLTEHVLKEANKAVMEILKDNLIFSQSIRHSYPHCWRCKNPIIYRATLQWFLQVHDKFRQKLLKEIKLAKVKLAKSLFVILHLNNCVKS